MTPELVTDPRRLAEVTQLLWQRTDIQLDLETTGLRPYAGDQILLCAIDEFVIHWRRALPTVGDLNLLRGVLEHTTITKHVFNASFDGMFLFHRANILLRNVKDPMLGAMLLKAGLPTEKGTFSLVSLLEKCLSIPVDPDWKKAMQMSFVGADYDTFEPTNEQIAYAAGDTHDLIKLSRFIEEKLASAGMTKVWKLENAYSQVIAQMQSHGAPLDVAAYTPLVQKWIAQQRVLDTQLREQLTPSILELRRIAFEQARAVRAAWDIMYESETNALEELADRRVKVGLSGTRQARRGWVQSQQRAFKEECPSPPVAKLDANPINLNSDRDVKAAFGELGVKLDGMQREDLMRAKLRVPDVLKPLLTAAIERSKVEKLASTYGQGLLEQVADGALHSDFQQIIATGRISSRDPNLQNLPEITRKYIRAKPGTKFLICDYPQVELRIAAEFALRHNPQSNDAIIRAFRDGIDLHSFTAVSVGLMPGVNYDTFVQLVQAKDPRATVLRKAGKVTNFAALFGIGPETLAIRIHADRMKDDPTYSEELSDEHVALAERLTDSFWQTNPTTQKFIEECGKQALDRGSTETMLGRRRYYDVPKKGEPDYWRRAGSVKRQAGNHPIQGTSADITKLAQVLIQREFWDNAAEAWLWDAVHDEICGGADDAWAEMGREVIERNAKYAYSTFIKAIPADEIACSITEVWEK